jgi:hypothetical protein
VGGLAPETQAALFHRALASDLSPADFERELRAQSLRRQP